MSFELIFTLVSLSSVGIISSWYNSKYAESVDINTSISRMKLLEISYVIILIFTGVSTWLGWSSELVTAILLINLGASVLYTMLVSINIYFLMEVTKLHDCARDAFTTELEKRL